MSLQSDVLLGVQSPQIVLLPVDVHSLDAAEEAIELADAYGFCRGGPPDESQCFNLRAGMGTRADGSWAAKSMGDCQPRQNGKNDIIAIREGWGLIVGGERLILHTAHEAATAKQSFERMVEVFDDSELRAKVRNIRFANGEQGIHMKSGRQLLYRTRTGSAGRGFAEADLVVYDEAQNIQGEQLAASAPTKLANPNSQSWYAGSAGLFTSTAWWRLRKRALAGKPGRYAYCEHTAEQVSMVEGRIVSVRPDPLDRRAWAMANAAYGWRIPDENLLDLYEELGPEKFARECLGVWDPESGGDDGAWPPGVFEAVVQPGAEPSGRIVVAVDATPDRSAGAVALAGGGVVALVTDERGQRLPVRFRDLADEAIRLARKFGSAVALDPAGPANAIVPALEEAGVEVFPVAGQAFGAACGAFHSAVSDGVVTVRRHADLTAAVGSAVMKPTGDSWRWARRDLAVDVSPLVAVTLAWWAAQQVVPDEVFSGGFVDLDDL